MVFLLSWLIKKRPAHLSIVERLGGFWCCKGKAFIWIVQGFCGKSVEMEVIFNRCWVLEMKNAASANQSWSSTNHIGRFEGSGVRYLKSIYNWEMARTARKHSDSGVYHVILRVVNKPQIYHKYGRIGHLFQERFKSQPVGDWGYFLTLLRYTDEFEP